MVNVCRLRIMIIMIIVIIYNITMMIDRLFRFLRAFQSWLGSPTTSGMLYWRWIRITTAMWVSTICTQPRARIPFPKCLSPVWYCHIIKLIIKLIISIILFPFLTLQIFWLPVSCHHSHSLRSQPKIPVCSLCPSHQLPCPHLRIPSRTARIWHLPYRGLWQWRLLLLPRGRKRAFLWEMEKPSLQGL